MCVLALRLTDHKDIFFPAPPYFCEEGSGKKLSLKIHFFFEHFIWC